MLKSLCLTLLAAFATAAEADGDHDHDHSHVMRYMVTGVDAAAFDTAGADMPGLKMDPYYEIHNDDGIEFFEVTFDMTYQTGEKRPTGGDQFNVAWQIKNGSQDAEGNDLWDTCLTVVTPKDTIEEIDNSVATLSCDTSANPERFSTAGAITISDDGKNTAWTVIRGESSFMKNEDDGTATISVRFQRPFIATDERKSDFSIKQGDALTANYLLYIKRQAADAISGWASVTDQEWMVTTGASTLAVAAAGLTTLLLTAF